MPRTNNRLTVIGPKAQLQRFHRSAWAKSLGARFCETLENAPERFACQFETEDAPLGPLRRLSRRFPGLTLLLDYENESIRTKGLAKAAAGKLEHCQLNY